jgi:hypothetical protein
LEQIPQEVDRLVAADRTVLGSSGNGAIGPVGFVAGLHDQRVRWLCAG